MRYLLSVFRSMFFMLCKILFQINSQWYTAIVLPNQCNCCFEVSVVKVHCIKKSAMKRIDYVINAELLILLRLYFTVPAKSLPGLFQTVIIPDFPVIPLVLPGSLHSHAHQ